MRYSLFVCALALSNCQEDAAKPVPPSTALASEDTETPPTAFTTQTCPTDRQKLQALRLPCVAMRPSIKYGATPKSPLSCALLCST